MKRIFISLIFMFFGIASFAQPCDTSALITLPVQANDTDANIPLEGARHYTFFNPVCTSKNTLLIFLVGTYGNPLNTLLFPKLAANNGFHVLSLKYKNGLSAQSACNNSSDPDCHLKFRHEVLEGIDYSPEVTVDSVNSVYNRLIRLLQYMDNNYPSQNWGQFFQGDSVLWNKTMVAGHSQGGGHAAVIAMDHETKRVMMFASPNDYSSFFNQTAPWTTAAHLTPDSVYYSLNNTYDLLIGHYDRQYTAALNLGEGTYGDTVNIDKVQCPYENTHNLYISRDSSGLLTNHDMMIMDDATPMGVNGEPEFLEVWQYMLGLPCGTLSIAEHVMTQTRELVKIIDVTGREAVAQKNRVLIYLYSDGTTERKFEIE